MNVEADVPNDASLRGSGYLQGRLPCAICTLDVERAGRTIAGGRAVETDKFRRTERFERCLATIGIAVLLASGCSSPIKQGIQLEQQGKYEDAIVVYEKIAAKKPGSPEALQAQLRIADAYITNLNKTNEGMAVYQKIVEMSPKSDEGLTARYRMGLVCFKNDDFSGAEAQFRGVLNDSPMTKFGADAQLMLAKTYEKAQKFEEAEKTYNAFTTLHPSDPNAAAALLSRARLLEQTGKKEEAVTAYQRVVRDFGSDASLQEQVKLATEALQKEGASVPKPAAAVIASSEPGAPAEATPRRPMTREERRQAFIEQMRERQRTPEQKKVAEEKRAASIWGIDPEVIMKQMNVTVDSQGTMYDAMYSMAVTMYQSEAFREAGALYERSIELAEADSNRKSSWENLGGAYKGLADVFTKLGLTDRAQEYLQKAYQRDPTVLDQIIDSGLVDYGAGDYEKAIQTWQALVGISPAKDAQLFYNIALAYQKQNDTPNEVQYLERAVAANPSYKDALQNLAAALYYRAGERKRSYVFQDAVEEKGNFATTYELGRLAFTYGYFTNATAQFNLAIRQAENDDDRAASSAMKLASQGSRSAPEAILAELDALVTANPNNARVHFARGAIAVVMNDAAKAEMELKKAMELQPTFTDALVALAGYYIEADDRDAAIALYDEYLKANPRDRNVQLRRDALKVASRTTEPAPIP
jgi:tetratricopeptide (TPR) repeat protein